MFATIRRLTLAALLLSGAAQADEDYFHITGHEVSVDRAVPQICVTFDRALARPLPLPAADYVAASAGEALEVTAAKDRLCLAGYQHGTTAELTVRAGLPAADGTRLDADVPLAITIADRPASVLFSRSAYILPKTGPAEIPLRTVNVPRLELDLMRVPHRNLRDLLGEEILGQSLDGWRSDMVANDIGAPVWHGELTIDGAVNREVATRLPLDSLVDPVEPGVYVLTAATAEMQEYSWEDRPAQWLVITDLGITTYSSRAGLDVQLRSLAAAEPVAGASLQLIARNNDLLAEAESDGDGWVHFAPGLLRGAGGDRAALITARVGDDDFAFIALDGPGLDLSDRGDGGRATQGPLEAFLFSERGAYRPGESVHLRALLRDAHGDGVGGLPLTVTVTRPDGVEAFKTVAEGDTVGGYAVEIPIALAVPTGQWRLSAHTDPDGPAVGQLYVLVKDFVPERLELSLTADRERLATGDPLTITAQADYLYGAPGAGLSVGGRMLVERDPAPFADFADYAFGLTDEFEQKVQRLDRIDSDDSGRAVFATTVPAGLDASGPLRALVSLGVRDTDGREVRRGMSLPVFATPVAIGLKALFGNAGAEPVMDEGGEARFEAIALAPDGKPLAGRTLTIQWLREIRDYDWYRDYDGWHYRVTVHDSPLNRELVTTDTDGRIELARTFDGWGTYRVDVYDDETGAGAAVAFRAGWRAVSQAPDTPEALSLALSDEDVVPGDELKIFVKAAFAGKATVTIAGEALIWRQNVTLPADGAEIAIPVSEDWRGGVYVMATAYRPGTEETGRVPARALGMRWVSVDTASRSLDVAIEAPDEARPGEIVTVALQAQAASAEPLYATLFAVDEGILQITNFASPRPEPFFFGQRRFAFDVHDYYGRVIRAADGESAAFELRATPRVGGGAAALRNLLGSGRRTFKTVALVAGPVALDADGKAEVTLSLPDFNGRLRLMAVVHGKTALGSGEDAMLVRAPVVAEMLPPLFLAPGDVAETAYRMHNLSGPAGEYTVTLAGEGPLTVHAEPFVVTLDADGKADTRFPVEATEAGDAALALLIEGPDGYRHERRWELAVRPPRPWTSERNMAVLSPGESLDLDGDDLDIYEPGTGELSITVSNRPDLDVPALLAALDRYPYGCLEQSISSTMPLVYLDEVDTLWGGGNIDRATLPGRIAAGIARIEAKMTSSGGFGLWSSSDSVQPWLTAYAYDFLDRARSRGHPVSEAVMERSGEWLRRYLMQDSAADHVPAKAYALMVLTRSGVLGASEARYWAERLAPNAKRLLALAQLEATLAHSGDAPAAPALASLTAGQGAKGARPTPAVFYGSYGSPLRDIAAALATVGPEGLKPGLWNKGVEILEREYEASAYTSTQEKVWLLLGARAMLQGTGEGMSFSAGGESLAGRQEPYYRTLSAAEIAGGFSVTNDGQAGDLRVYGTRTGVPAMTLPPAHENMVIERRLYTLDGAPLRSRSMRQGERVLVVLAGRSLSRWEHRALVVDLLPAGLEIQQGQLGGSELAKLNIPAEPKGEANFATGANMEPVVMEYLTEPEYEAVRDDRYVAAVDLNRRRPAFTLAYIAQVVTPGVYAYPAATIEDMYRPEYFARTNEDTLRVMTAR
jgi:alpha-2-macroglobulin